MHPIHIKSLLPKTLAGFHLNMSLATNRTAELWRSFMPIGAQLSPINSLKYSLECYPMGYFEQFSATTEFEKWALVEIESNQVVDPPFERFRLEGGEYAVIHYRGLGGDPSVYQWFYSEWLPQSGYLLDQRPHFEVLDERYKNGDPTSEEEIWIPIKRKLNYSGLI